MERTRKPATEPGTYRVHRVGDVDVEQADIERAAELGGDPKVEIAKSTAFQNEVKTFVLGHFIPEQLAAKKGE